MYREQKYIFSFTFVYKPKMASLGKIRKKTTKQKKINKNKELQFIFMDAEDFTPVHLSWSYFFFPHSLDTNGIIFFTVT